jgi:carboxymethylenebutenolidase
MNDKTPALEAAAASTAPDRSDPDWSTPDRRRLLLGLMGIAGASFLAGLPTPAAAQGAPAAPAASGAEDPRLQIETVSYATKKQPCRCYLVKPKAAGRRPGVVVLHDQRGPSAHFRQFARKLALYNFNVAVPDLVSPVATVEETSDEALKILERMPEAEALGYVHGAVDLLGKLPEHAAGIGVVGFVWGGIPAVRMAFEAGRVRAVVLYYALPPLPDTIQNLKVPLQLHYAGLDQKTAPLVEPVEKKLMGHAKVYEQYVYDNTLSSFANETQPKRYNAQAAELAFERTELFLKRYLAAST